MKNSLFNKNIGLLCLKHLYDMLTREYKCLCVNTHLYSVLHSNETLFSSTHKDNSVIAHLSERRTWGRIIRRVKIGTREVHVFTARDF